MNKAAFPILRAFLLAFAASWNLRCSDTLMAQNGGGGSETINAKIIVSDTVARVQADLRQGTGVEVRVFARQYKPFERFGFADSVSGDAAFPLVWNAPFSGEFNFLLSAGGVGTQRRAAFIPALGLSPGASDTISCALSKCVAFKGSLASPDRSQSFVLYIQGSPFFCVSDTVGRFAMPSLPSGCFILKTRPVQGRLFLKTNDYTVNTDSLGENVAITIEEP
jgi:hypothetical protein